jgi:pimeloyl-ACP methyl ester carboxylesterase
MGDLRSEYRALRPALRQAGYRVVTMDVRGFGESSAQWRDLSARAVAATCFGWSSTWTPARRWCWAIPSPPARRCAAREAPQQVRGVALLGPIVRDGEPNWLMSTVVKLGFAGPWRVRFG